jgi:hypothetical protein
MASVEWDELFGNAMIVMVESSAIVSRKPLKNSNGGEAGARHMEKRFANELVLVLVELT